MRDSSRGSTSFVQADPSPSRGQGTARPPAGNAPNATSSSQEMTQPSGVVVVSTTAQAADWGKRVASGTRVKAAEEQAQSSPGAQSAPIESAPYLPPHVRQVAQPAPGPSHATGASSAFTTGTPSGTTWVPQFLPWNPYAAAWYTNNAMAGLHPFHPAGMPPYGQIEPGMATGGPLPTPLIPQTPLATTARVLSSPTHQLPVASPTAAMSYPGQSYARVMAPQPSGVHPQQSPKPRPSSMAGTQPYARVPARRTSAAASTATRSLPPDLTPAIVGTSGTPVTQRTSEPRTSIASLTNSIVAEASATAEPTSPTAQRSAAGSVTDTPGPAATDPWSPASPPPPPTTTRHRHARLEQIPPDQVPDQDIGLTALGVKAWVHHVFAMVAESRKTAPNNTPWRLKWYEVPMPLDGYLLVAKSWERSGYPNWTLERHQVLYDAMQSCFLTELYDQFDRVEWHETDAPEEERAAPPRWHINWVQTMNIITNKMIEVLESD